jgi:O-methyltransferase
MPSLIRRYYRRYLHLFDSDMKFPQLDAHVKRAVAYMPDAVRYKSLSLAIRRIEIDNIPGDFAELGVWRGITSAFLHSVAPSRTLHLFDSFEGFQDGRFKDSSPEFVRNRIGDCTNVVFHVGYFPETASSLKTTFALVMLDADTYESTFAGLQWFYPRLNSGAYLFMHDYNSPESNAGVSRAWSEFSPSIKEKLIEIPDQWGSAMFRKI